MTPRLKNKQKTKFGANLQSKIGFPILRHEAIVV